MNVHIALSAMLLAVVFQLCCANDPNGYYTNRFMVQVDGDSEMAEKLARALGMKSMGHVGRLKDVFLFDMGKGKEKVDEQNIMKWIEMNNALKNDKHVKYFEPELMMQTKKYFYSEPTDPLWNSQWFILNDGSISGYQFGRDVNAERAWLQGITGCGSIVTVVDEGLDYTHPDISGSYIPEVSLDICGNDNDPFISSNSESHATAVAGEIVGAKSNGVCGTGIAYNAHVGSIRHLGCSVSISELITTATYRNDAVQIYSNSWGFVGDGDTVFGPGAIWTMALKDAMTVRGGRGSIIVFASGNEGTYDDDCGADGLSTSIYTISIGSAAVDGGQAFYDEKCSSKMAVNFVSGNGVGSIDVTTALPNGQCTTSFDGTSAACPVASAVIALALEANSDLTWRDVQYLIAYTSSHEKLTGGSPITNGGGLVISHEFGFGVMDAEAMVSRARHWLTVSQQQSTKDDHSGDSGFAEVGTPFETMFTYTGNLAYLEHAVVVMTVGVSNGRRGDLRVELTSPAGTMSILMDFRDNDGQPGSFINWDFMSVHFWGENPAGDWKLVIRSRGPRVDMSGFEVTFYGTDQIPPVIQNIPDNCHSDCDSSKGCAGSGSEHCDACKDYRNSHTGECITACPATYLLRNGYCYDPNVEEPTCQRPGSCVARGYSGCCDSGSCIGSEPSQLPSCYCDDICHGLGDCCEDIADASCPAPDNTNTLDFIDFSSASISLPSIDDGSSSAIDVPEGGFPMGSQSFSSVYVNTNGILSMGSPFTQYSPSLFPISGQYLVAPLWADVNIAVGVGNIHYKVYSSGDSLLEMVNMFIQQEENFNFVGSWMIVAKWDGVPRYGGSTQETNTYQAIMATDGTNSFAVFTYKCGDLEWDGGATIGFGASSEMFSNLRLSGTGRSIAIACLNDPGNQFSNVVFELTDSRDVPTDPGPDPGPDPDPPCGDSDTLEFINNTPRASDSSIDVELCVGTAYVTVTCDVDGANSESCFDGTVSFSGLRANRNHSLNVLGTRSDGSQKSLSRWFYTDDSDHCLVLLINEGVRVEGNTALVEWQKTGPGDSVPLYCKLRGLTRYTPCDSPYRLDRLESGETYHLIVQYSDRRRVVCRRRRLTRIYFSLP